MNFLDSKVSLSILEKFRPCSPGQGKLVVAAGAGQISLRDGVEAVGLPEVMWACRIAEREEDIAACGKFITWAAAELAHKYSGVPPMQMHPSALRFMSVSARALSACPHKAMLAAYYALTESGTKTPAETAESFLRLIES